MAILTELKIDEIRDACGAFGVRAATAEGVLAGSVNTNYAITTEEGGRFFLRLYEEQDHAGAARETALADALVRAGVPTPAPLPRADGRGFTVERGDKAIALYLFVAGTIRCQKGVTTEDTGAVGRALAQVHLAGKDLDAALTGPSRFGAEAIRARLDGLPGGNLSSEVASARDRLLGSLDGIADPEAGTPELRLVHGDLFRDNVLFHERGLVLLDFESASRGTASFDLAVTLLAWCFGDGFETSLSRSLIEGYTSVRPLSAEEIADVPRAARLACVRFAATRITDYELRPPGVGIKKDFRRWIARLDAIEQAPQGIWRLFAG